MRFLDRHFSIAAMAHLFLQTSFLVILFASVFESCYSQEAEGPAVQRVAYGGYEDCAQISNGRTRIILGHQFGGRLLAYESEGKNILYLDPKEAEWNLNNIQSPRVSAGRFDVGPEYLMPRTQFIWSGKWEVKVTGDLSARMTSQIDPTTSIQVTRDFELDKDSSHLKIKQTVLNKGDQLVRHNYWSRTFVIHGGVAVIPCDPHRSLIPNLYYVSQHRYLINFRPEDPAVRRVKDYLVVDSPPEFPKLGFDCAVGWVAYQAPNDLLFVKKWPVFPDRKYGDPGEIQFSLWYPTPNKFPACEIEPIGPLVPLKPGQKSSFTVDWWLLERPFPKSGKVDPHSVAKQVESECQLPVNSE
jgi:hypothetical protein